LNNKRFVYIFTIVLVSLFLICCSSYDMFVELTIENKTSQTIRIYINEYDNGSPTFQSPYYIGSVSAKSTKIIKKSRILPVFDSYLIQATTKSGNIIFTKYYTWEELNNLGLDIVIE
jgi:hypothetical protein